MPDALVFVIVLAILVLVVLVVSAPLRRGGAESAGGGSAVAELEAARDAKYREIRDAELDRETGKLSQADWEAIDQALRAEALEILNALERVRAPGERLPSRP